MRPERRTTRGLRPVDRHAFSWRGVVIALALLGAVPALVWSMLPGMKWSSGEIMPRLQAVGRAEFLHTITERGNVESASNVEIRCEIQALGTAGTRILQIVPEGTYVQTGDILVQLDSSSLENDRVKQQISCESSKALLIQAENDFKLAQKALDEYIEGTFKVNLEAAKSKLSVNNEMGKRARDVLAYSQQLYAKGYITRLQFEGDKFALEKAEADQRAAELELKVLKEFTKVKTETQLKSDIETARAKLEAQRYSHQLDTQKLQLIETQIAKCVVKAPQPGQVVYANNKDRFSSENTIIEEGALVRERQVIVRLPDPKRMQVTAKINEAKVSLVKEGMPATIRLDAYPDVELQGTVKKVNEYPAPAAWHASNIKEYETIIDIPELSVGLKPGLTAEVKIRIDYQPSALQLPVQALFEHGGKYYGVLRDGDRWVAREVEVGATNDKVAVIKNGLSESEEVVLNAAAFRDKAYGLPPLDRNSDTLSMLARKTGSPGAKGSEKGAPAKALAGKAPTADKLAATEARLVPVAARIAAATAEPLNPAAAGSGQGERAAAPEKHPAADKSPSAEKVADGASQSEQLLQQFDKNRDGALELRDLSDNWRTQLSGADANGDGRLDRAELTAALSHAKKAISAGGRP